MQQQQRSKNAWRLSPWNVQYVGLGRASQHLRFHCRLLSFLVRDMFNLTSPSMNHYLLKSYFSFCCSARSPLWARTFRCQIYTSPDQTNWQFSRDNGLQPTITRHAPHRFVVAWVSGVFGSKISPGPLGRPNTQASVVVERDIRYVTYISKSH